jgi:hypothetical protein
VKMAFADTLRFGRRGEVVWFHYIVQVCEFIAFDQSAAANGRAPVLHQSGGNLIAPDAWLFHDLMLFGECKTKRHHLDWRNDGEDMLPTGKAQGIDRRVYGAYGAANVKVPVVLFIICVEDGTIYAASLDELGQPTPSLQPTVHPMVNWSLNLFTPIVVFDRDRLDAFLNKPVDIEVMPDAAQGRRLLDWLRPQQYELNHFRADLLHRLERRWGKRA